MCIEVHSLDNGSCNMTLAKSDWIKFSRMYSQQTIWLISSFSDQSLKWTKEGSWKAKSGDQIPEDGSKRGNSTQQRLWITAGRCLMVVTLLSLCLIPGLAPSGYAIWDIPTCSGHMIAEIDEALLHVLFMSGICIGVPDVLLAIPGISWTMKWAHWLCYVTLYSRFMGNLFWIIIN